MEGAWETSFLLWLILRCEQRSAPCLSSTLLPTSSKSTSCGASGQAKASWVDLRDQQIASARRDCMSFSVWQSGGVEEEIRKVCQGCRPDQIVRDANKTCFYGREKCTQRLKANRSIHVLGLRDGIIGGYHQNLAEWKDSPLKWRPTFQRMFYVPVPRMKPPVALPSNTDLVIHFRPYLHKTCWDYYQPHKRLRLASVPFAFYEWAVEEHRKEVQQNFTVWVVADPNEIKLHGQHPTLKLIIAKLGAKLFKGMYDAPEPSLGDFSWLRSALFLVTSISTFSWWAAYLSDAQKVYVPMLPMPSLAPWCDLMLNDTRYVVRDWYARETFQAGNAARARCWEYEQCNERKTCPPLGQLVFRYYPEVAAKLKERSREFALLRETNRSN